MKWICGVLAGLAAAWPLEAQWNRFRGPNGSGVEGGAGYPVEFSPRQNVVWKAAVPLGQSSPVLAGNRVFVTASEGEKLLTLCYDAATGGELWRREVRRERPHKIFKANDPASPTPAADDGGVYAFFPDYGLVAYTLDGKPRWTHPLGPFKSFYGMGASPILWNDLVVLLCDQQTGSFLLAVDRNTGRRRWRTERPGIAEGWSTPMVYQPAAGQAELIVLGSTRLDSYYAATGEPRWQMPLTSQGSMGTPVAAGETIWVSTAGSSQPMVPAWAGTAEKLDKNKDGRISEAEFQEDKEFAEHFGWVDSSGDGFIDQKEWEAVRSYGVGNYGAIAVKPGAAKGALTEKAVAWRFKRNLPYIPAPLVYQGVFYMVRDGGIFTALDPATGALRKEGRTGAMGEYYASPVAADGKIYAVNVEGKMAVVKAGAQWDVLKVNDLGEETHATPALAGGRLYVRTRGHLYCFGQKN